MLIAAYWLPRVSSACSAAPICTDSQGPIKLQVWQGFVDLMG
jgi:hypothetical protein